LHIRLGEADVSVLSAHMNHKLTLSSGVDDFNQTHPMVDNKLFSERVFDGRVVGLLACYASIAELEKKITSIG
jgi:hypothetical protein